MPLLRLGINENLVGDWIKRSSPVPFNYKLLKDEMQQVCDCELQVHKLDPLDLIKVFRQWPDMPAENAAILDKGLLVLGWPGCRQCSKPFLVIGDEDFIRLLIKKD